MLLLAKHREQWELNARNVSKMNLRNKMIRDKNNLSIIEDVVIKRRNFIELIIVVVLIALGVNFISGSILALTNVYLFIIIIGILLCITSILYLAVRFLGIRTSSCSFEAFLIYDRNKNEIISVPRYNFSEEIKFYLRAVFLENPALKTIWEKDSLKKWKEQMFKEPSEGEKNVYKIRPSKSAQLISEATEYFILDELSTHLTDYFHSLNLKTKNLKEYCREDIPQVLLSNRFLEIFSRSMEDRPHFVKEGLQRDENEDVSRVYAGGTMYDKFILILPKKSKVRRPEKNIVEINTKKLKMFIAVDFIGFNINVPEGFMSYYLGIKDWRDIEIFMLDISANVTMKLRALFSKAGWEYYRWVDSFLKKIEENVALRAFFNQIGWEAVYTTLHCINLSKDDGLIKKETLEKKEAKKSKSKKIKKGEVR